MKKNEAAAALGKLGRAANTDAQKEASRRNGRAGGRPNKYRCTCGAYGIDLGRTYRYGGVEIRCTVCGRHGPGNRFLAMRRTA